MRGRRPSLVGRLLRKCRHSGDQREAGIRRRAGLPRAFGALRSRLGRASESLSASCFNSHLPQFKIKNSKFKIPAAFLRPSLRGSSPFGLSEGPSFSNAWRHQYAQLKTQNSQLKTVACPPLLGDAGGVGGVVK
jgi:hypothetical protein